MQTASGTLAAAITAQERKPKVQLLIDWDNDGGYSQAIDDQSARVESVQIDRTLTTDLPDAVDLLAGYSTATATVTLSGDPTDETKSATWYYSPYSTGSPIYGKRRRWRTALLALGFAGTAGTELLPAMTGKTRDVASNGRGRTATLDLFDNTELMRGSVDVPLVIANLPNTVTWHPSLSSSWVVDYIARQCGFYAAPPLRPNCVFAASFAGSAYPFVGTPRQMNRPSGPGQGLPVAFAATGKFIQGTAGDAVNTLAYDFAGSVSVNDGGEVLLEGWVNFSGNGQQGWGTVENSAAVGAPRISLTTGISGNLQVSVRRTSGGAITTYNSGLVISANQWTYVGVHVYLTSSTITIHCRVGGTTASTSLATSSVTATPALTFVGLTSGEDASGVKTGDHAGFEAWQISNPGIGSATPSWNDAYVGNAIIQPSPNTLTATVPMTDAAIAVIQQIASAEFATAGFDELGRFTFYTRNRWTSAPYTTSQRTIDASSLKDLTVTEATDQVRNRIRATASPAAVQNAGFVWRVADVVTVPASGSTTVTAMFDNAATGVGATITYAAVNNPTSSYYRANRAADGSGTTVNNLTFTVTVTGTTATITINNSNAFAVYLVNSAGFTDGQGTPALGLWGQAVLYAQSPTPDTTTPGVTVPTQTVYDVVDATSKSQHGEQLLEIPVNPWLQDGSSLATLVADLLARLKDPPPVVTGLSIPYDPRLQLGDRVTVIADPFGLSADFFVIGSHVTVTIGGGADQTLDTRAV